MYDISGPFCLLYVGFETESFILSLMGINSGRYRYMQDLIDINSCFPQVTNHSLVRGPSPLNLAALLPYLQRDPDQQYASYIYILESCMASVLVSAAGPVFAPHKEIIHLQPITLALLLIT